MDTNAPFALIVGGYSTQVGALEDFAEVWSHRMDGAFHHTSIAALTTGTDGTPRVARSNSTAKHILWGGALLGGPLFVVAPSAGAELLAMTGLDGAGVIIEHLRLHTERRRLAETTALLEQAAFGLVVVVLNCRSRAVTPLLSHADRTISLDMAWGDLEEELSETPRWRDPAVVLIPG
jgi:hypothetical protein